MFHQQARKKIVLFLHLRQLLLKKYTHSLQNIVLYLGRDLNGSFLNNANMFIDNFVVASCYEQQCCLKISMCVVNFRRVGLGHQ